MILLDTHVWIHWSMRMTLLVATARALDCPILTSDENILRYAHVRAIGPSLTRFGIADPLSDPTLSLFDSNGSMIAFNDNWSDDSNARFIDPSLQPTDRAESAILTALAPGAYTAIVGGKGDATGVALVEVYALH